MRFAVVVSLLVLATLTGCSQPAGSPDNAAIPTRALPKIDLPRAVLADGATIDLEIAVSEEERRTGLMFRPSLPDNRGMLFIFDEPGDLSIWMKNTYITLDIVFLDDSGLVVAVSEDAPPCQSEPCPQYRSGQPAHAVLELVAGSAARHGIVPGARLRFENVAGYPLIRAE